MLWAVEPFARNSCWNNVGVHYTPLNLLLFKWPLFLLKEMPESLLIQRHRFEIQLTISFKFESLTKEIHFQYSSDAAKFGFLEVTGAKMIGKEKNKWNSFDWIVMTMLFILKVGLINSKIAVESSIWLESCRIKTH